jgi:hypothetical protein
MYYSRREPIAASDRPVAWSRRAEKIVWKVAPYAMMGRGVYLALSMNKAGCWFPVYPWQHTDKDIEKTTHNWLAASNCQRGHVACLSKWLVDCNLLILTKQAFIKRLARLVQTSIDIFIIFVLRIREKQCVDIRDWIDLIFGPSYGQCRRGLDWKRWTPEDAECLPRRRDSGAHPIDNTSIVKEARRTQQASICIKRAPASYNNYKLFLCVVNAILTFKNSSMSVFAWAS